MILAKYIRLSSADEDAKYGDKPESNSVSNQRLLLDRYIETRAEFSGSAVLEFLDDGRSGTNFSRPGVSALLEAAKHRKIDCIIVKDFSRFGRNYLEVGSYLEQVFPFLGIRFISVNDGYDSRDYPYGTAGDLGSGIRNLVNELYSRELSQKSKDSKRQYAERGQCIAAYPIYGYIKSPEDRRTWIPDPDAAEIVRHIFRRFLDGAIMTEIAAGLNVAGVPTPSQHKRAMGSKRQLWNSEEPQNDWGQSTIDRILRDERYTGKLIGMKTTLTELGNIHSAKKLAKDDWVVVPDAFPSLISQEIFDAVQQRIMKGKRPRAAAKPVAHLFTRKLKCGYCGLAPVRRSIVKGVYYCCEGNRWNAPDDCKKVRIFEEDLKQAVLASIRFQAQLARKAERRMERQAHSEASAQRRAEQKNKRLQMQIDRFAAQKKDVYLEYDQGKLSQAEYRDLCARVEKSIAECKEKLDSVGVTETKGPAVDINFQSQADVLKEFSNLRTLDRRIVEKLIRSIRLYADNKIEIVWNFNDEYMNFLTEDVP